MTDAVIDPLEARRLIEARLGRRPQDMLEAAVALEAWAGIPAQGALDTAREVMRVAPSEPEASTGALPDEQPEKGALVEALTFLMTVIAIACWAAPLAASVGSAVVERAVMLALPVTLGLQWGLSSRYFSREQGRSELARHAATLALAAGALAGLGWLSLGQAGLLAALLTTTWVGGTILVRCNRAGVYGAGILLATGAMAVGADPPTTLASVAAAVVLATFLTLPPARDDAPHGAGARWTRVAGAAAVGAGTGVLLIIDPTVSWTDGAVPAVALLPPSVAGFWASFRLRGLGHAIPRAASGVRVGERAPHGLESAPLRLLLTALGELVVIAAALSAALLLLTPWLGAPGDAAGVLVGFALLAPATLLAGVLEALGRCGTVLVAVAVAACAAAWVSWTDLAPFDGAGLVVGGAVVTAMLLPVAIAVLGRPASTLATTLWIT